MCLKGYHDFSIEIKTGVLEMTDAFVEVILCRGDDNEY